MLHGDAVGRGRKHDIARRQRFFVRFGKGEINMTTQILEKVGDLPASLAARGDGRKFYTCGCSTSRRSNSTPV